MNGLLDTENGVFDTANKQFQQLPKTTQQIILIYTEATNKIFDQCYPLTDSVVNHLIPTLNSNGTVKYYKKGQQYQDDLPAVISQFRVVKYYENDQCYHHRDDGNSSVILYQNEIIHYYKNGKLHRDGDLPAIIWKGGRMEYYKNGLRHRDGDLPADTYPSGTHWYYKNGQRHRDGDLPAVIWQGGTVGYYKNDKLYFPL